MSGQKVKIDGFAKELASIMQEYADTTGMNVKAAVDKVAKDTVKDLKGASPKAAGKYAKGWGKKVTSENSVKKTQTIYNKHYQRVHLLEKGHAKRNGGRVEAKPHVYPAEQRAIKELEDEIRKGVIA